VPTEGISTRLEAFIAAHVESVGQLEVLLLLHADPARAWDAAAVAQALRVDAAWAGETLAALTDRRLAARVPGQTLCYRYAIEQSNHAAVDELARAYADRRVTVIQLIFAKPADRLRVFADAFRLFKDDRGGKDG
jgi:hypothetical protein